MQGQRFILFTLFLTVTYGTKINFFDAIVYIPPIGNQSTVHDKYLELWTDVTDCSPSPCSCQVYTNASSDQPFPVIFLLEKPNKGSVAVSNLESDTMYSFTLECVGADKNETRNVRTDYGKPSAPQQITVTLNSKRLRVSWLRPLLPAGPIHKYRLTINQNPVIDNLPSDTFSYDMTEDYAYGTEYKFTLEACNENRRNETVCSNRSDGMISFNRTMTTTTPVSEGSTKPNSASVLSYSMFILFFICSLLLFS